MAGWNFGTRKRHLLAGRKSRASGGVNSPELVALAETYIGRGWTRQRAYARARKKLEEKWAGEATFVQGGDGSKK